MNIRLELRKPFHTDPLHVLNITDGCKFSILSAIPKDALSQDRPDTRQPSQFLYRTAINIDVNNVCHRHGLRHRESHRRRADLLHGQSLGLRRWTLQQARKRQKPHGSGKEQKFDSE